MDYIPTPVAQPAPAPSSYELKKDVTGKPPEPRGIFSLQDKNGQVVNLPYPPNKNCNKCHGRGKIGFNAVTGRLIVCHRCYRKQ